MDSKTSLIVFGGLALLIIIVISKIIKKISSDIVKEKKKIIKAKQNIENDILYQTRLKSELTEKENLIKKRETELQKILDEKSQKFPYLATILSDWKYMHDTELANLLKTKKRPAIKASEEVQRISREKRILEKKCRVYEHQLKMYEELFPWLEEFSELPPEDAYSYISKQDEQDEYSRIKDWLSPEEYSKLSDVRKWQLALDRYIQKDNKTSWLIGIEYERYIGYLYEMEGYKVSYEGALMGLEDKGRDLVVEKGNVRLVIQCKRWSKEKEIHEKHIMQLFGSVAELNLKDDKNYRGVFITTTKLSKMAQHFAKLLNIEIHENIALKSYPLIKCNISANGEKIYHLPFDQQYDRVHMDMKKGNVYVKTVLEAELKGFRHAYRWKGSTTSQ